MLVIQPSKDRGLIMPIPDIITLQNLEQKLPLWSPGVDNHLQAVVDMGRSVTIGVCSWRFMLTRLQQWHPLLHHRSGAANYTLAASYLLHKGCHLPF